MKRYLFFLRHFNDIDNIAPAIYFFLEDSPANRADVILYVENYDYRDDPNLTFLKQRFGDRFSFSWLGDSFGLPVADAQLGARAKRRLNRVIRRASAIVGVALDERIKAFWQGIGLFRKDRLWLGNVRRGYSDPARTQAVLAKILSEPMWPDLVVFDVVRSCTVKGLLDGLRAVGVRKIICLPTSPLINYNLLREKTLVDVYSEAFRREQDYSGFDALGFVDESFVRSSNELLPMVGLSSDLLGKTRRLGSIRYCPEWLRIRQEFIPPLPGEPRSGRIRVLFLLSRSVSNVNVEEVLIAFRLLALFPDFDVRVKGHTRDDDHDLHGRHDHISFCDEYSSTALIDWADIILFWSTSVAIEGYIKEKVMVCLRYLVANRNLYADYKAGYIAECRDDLLKVLLRYRKERKVPEYDLEGCRRFLREVVWARSTGESVPQRYLSFMREHECIASESTSRSG